jgi:hypothetical protein
MKFSGRPRSSPKRTPSTRRISTLFEHENLSSIEIKCQPNDEPHWDKIYTKYSKKTRKGTHPRFAKKLNHVNLSLRESTREGEISTDAGITPPGELTSSLYLRANITQDPVAATRRVRPRVTKTTGMVRPRVSRSRSRKKCHPSTQTGGLAKSDD